MLKRTTTLPPYSHLNPGYMPHVAWILCRRGEIHRARRLGKSRQNQVYRASFVASPKQQQAA